MFLSRLILNPRSHQVQREIREPYEMHRTLMKAFPSQNNGGPGRVLWRLDMDRRAGRAVAIVQSEKRPDWAFLNSKSYLLDPHDMDVDDNPALKEIDETDRREFPFENGVSFSFRLRANPTAKRRRWPQDKDTHRVGLIREEEQLAWLHRKASDNGFRVLSATVVCEDGPKTLAKGRKLTNGQERRLSILSVRFDGVFQVVDRSLFLDAFRNGIGPAKAFGFGLLSLAPP